MVIDITAENQYLIGKSKLPAVLSAYAPWCGPCQKMEPIIDKLAVSLKGVYQFYRLNVDDRDTRALAIQYGITAVPTFLFFIDSEVVGKVTGYMSKKDLVAKMDEVFQKIEDEDY